MIDTALLSEACRISDAQSEEHASFTTYAEQVVGVDGDALLYVAKQRAKLALLVTRMAAGDQEAIRMQVQLQMGQRITFAPTPEEDAQYQRLTLSYMDGISIGLTAAGLRDQTLEV